MEWEYGGGRKDSLQNGQEGRTHTHTPTISVKLRRVRSCLGPVSSTYSIEVLMRSGDRERKKREEMEGRRERTKVVEWCRKDLLLYFLSLPLSLGRV